MNPLINDICTFSLSLFGIGVTIFTVIYSFISNKKEYMNEIADVITSGKACPETKAKYIIAERYVSKQKTTNSIILSLTILSLVIYVLSLLYIRLESDNIILEYVVIGLNILLLIALLIALSKFISSYLKYIR